MKRKGISGLKVRSIEETAKFNSKVIEGNSWIGYVGASVPANRLFRFRRPKQEELCEYILLETWYSVSKRRDNPGWRKVRITVEILEQEQSTGTKPTFAEGQRPGGKP